MGMALTTVAELRSTLGVGTLYSDSVLQEVCDASDAVLIPMLWAPKWFSVAHSNVVGTGTLYFNDKILDTFYVGQSVTIANSGSSYAGTKTITAVGDYSISVATNHATAQAYHPIFPYGSVSTTTYTDWTTDTAVQNAALMIAVEIWQGRTATLSGSNSVDFQPSPYRLSAQLLAKIRGMIAHALDPRSMVG
jgi:hypothetical protein